jgi:hypothetical protein
LLSWYSDRLLSRIPAAERVMLSVSDIPQQPDEACGQMIFALMSDFDRRHRWRAAHCFRRAARLQLKGVIAATVSQIGRSKDVTFRDPAAPFYFLAAKLWLAIAMYRVSAESPSMLTPFKDEILTLARAPDLPHVGIREYAKQTITTLTSAKAVRLTRFEKTALDAVNTPLKGTTVDKRNGPYSFDSISSEKRRFKFDGLDTLRYWYDEILRIFPTVLPHHVLDIAERWIMDKWGAPAEANWWDKDPRKARYDERRFGLWSHSHGSLPVIERYGAHLEWNAMHCIMGELLRTHPIAESEFYSDQFEYWLGRCLPTMPPVWLADHRGPTPLERRLWIEDPRTDKGWVQSTRRNEFIAEIGLIDSSRPGWLVIDGYYSARFPKREASIHVGTALISPDTASALVRALQTAGNPWSFRIPNEDDDSAIDSPPYRLVGWIGDIESDTGFDDQDPCAYDVRRIRLKPGRELVEMFGLAPDADDARIWSCQSAAEAGLIYETWCDEPSPEEDYYPRRVRSDGFRLWARVKLVHPSGIEGLIILARGPRYSARGFPASVQRKGLAMVALK